MLASSSSPASLASRPAPAAEDRPALPLISWRLAGTVIVVVFGACLLWSRPLAHPGWSWDALLGMAPAALLLVMAGAASHYLEVDVRAQGRSLPWVRHVASQLVPLVLLTAAYPLVEHRTTVQHLGGVPVRTVLLAVSLTVPWVGQAVCMPLYAGITRELAAAAEDRAALATSLAGRVRGSALSTALVTAAVAGAVSSALHLGLVATVAYAGSLALHLLFMQLLVLAVLGRRHGLWALSWTGYALAVLLLPDRWWLPPLVGVCVLATALVRDLPCRPATVAPSGVAVELVKGALMGATLWADKLLLLLRSPGTFPASLSFLALVPALVTYNYYFARVAPHTEALVGELHRSMQHDPPSAYAVTKRALTTFVEDSVKTVLLLGAGLTLAAAVVLPSVTEALASAGGPDRTGTAVVRAGMLVWNWECVCVALMAYQLAYLGSSRVAYTACAAQALLVVLAFASPLSLAGTYAALAGAGTLVLLPLLLECRRQWAHPDHALFWRQAVRW